MARIRSIKPEFPHSESMGRVSRDARLTFLLMWTIADDEGRLRGNSRILASLLFPYDSDAGSLMEGWVAELQQEGCLDRYEVEGSTYIQIRNWLKHQKIDRPSKSKIPPFDESSRVLASNREASSGDLDLDLDREGKGRDQGPGPVPARAQDSRHVANPREDSPNVSHGTGAGEPNRTPAADAPLTDAEIEATYPATAHDRDAVTAQHSATGLVNLGLATWQDLRRRLQGFRAFADSGGYSGPDKTPGMAAWFQREQRKNPPYWAREWQAQPSKAERQQAENLDASLQWLREQEARDAAG